jgi:hypothetical protein
VPGDEAGEAIRLLHDERLVAVARAEGGLLKPYLVLEP